MIEIQIILNFALIIIEQFTRGFYMKSFFTKLLVLSFIPFGLILGIGGFGFQGGQSLLSVNSVLNTEGGATLKTSEFSNPFSGGGYLYIDLIPFIDLEADISLSL